MSKESIRKGKVRHESVQLRGPMWVDPRLKEKYKEYQLNWVGVSDHDAYTIGQYESIGFTFIPKSDLEELHTGESNLSRTYAEGNWICTATGAGTKAYLMKCPLELYNEYLESEEEKIKDRRRNMAQITKQSGIYGEIENFDE